MSSEDEYLPDRYDYRFDRRSSKKPRRRASSPRVQRQLDLDYLPRRSRRSKRIYPHPAPKLAGLIIIFILIAYEIIVLRGTVSSEDASSSEKQSENVSQRGSAHINANIQSGAPLQAPESRPKSEQKMSDSHQTLNSSTSSSFSSSSSSVSIHGSKNSPSASRGKDKDPSTQTKKDTATVKVSKETRSMHLPQSAIKMETQGADDDPDLEPPAEVKQKSFTATVTSDRADHNGRTKVRKTADAASKENEPGDGENFWNWFQENKGSEKKAVSKSLPCPEDNKRLCQMFYKYIRKYKIRKVFDVSCEKNVNWIGDILKKAGSELWGFKYYCSLWNKGSANDVREKLKGLPFVEFDDGKWWRAGFAEDTELLFAWDTLAHLAYGRVWNFFVKARKQDVKYVLVDNYPGILNDPSPKRDYLNLRKHPFRFPSAKEVAQNVTEPGETAKRQLLFYETSMLPDNLQ